MAHHQMKQVINYEYCTKKEKKKGAKTHLKIVAENFPNLRRDMDMVSTIFNPNKSLLGHIIIKLCQKKSKTKREF